MPPLDLDLQSTALVVIDLQQGILATPTVPHATSDVVAQSSRLVARCRDRNVLVVLVHVDPGPTGELFPRPITDVERPRITPPPGWSDFVPEMTPRGGDVVVTKHQPCAFYGTDLAIHLQRRGIRTIVLCGVATNIGVEATARVGFEHGYNLVFASDAMAGRDVELHACSVSKFFPTIGRVRTTDEILAALS